MIANPNPMARLRPQHSAGLDKRDKSRHVRNRYLVQPQQRSMRGQFAFSRFPMYTFYCVTGLDERQQFILAKHLNPGSVYSDFFADEFIQRSQIKVKVRVFDFDSFNA